MRRGGEVAVGSQKRGEGEVGGGEEEKGGERAACWRLGFGAAPPRGGGRGDPGVRWHVGWWEGVLAKLSRVILVKVLFSLLRVEINFSAGAYF
jgi:hypothetical protein